MKTFFQSPDQAPANLKAGELYPRGVLFPFGFYSTGGGSSAKRGELLCMDERFYEQNTLTRGHYVNFLGPAYEINEWVLEDAARCKVKAVYSVHTPGVEGIAINGQEINVQLLSELNNKHEEPDWEAIRAEVAKIVKKAAGDKNLAVWNLAPEELRSWNKLDMKLLKLVAETVRANDPEKRPLMLYLPNHYDSRTMKPFFPDLDLICRGLYVNYAGQKHSRIWVRWGMEEQLEAIKDAPDALCWALPEMFQEPPAEELPLIRNWVRHDTYLALACGAKGVMPFSASQRPKFECRQQYIDAYLEIARELNGDLKLGDAYLFGEVRNDLSLTVIGGPETVNMKFYDYKKDYPSLCMRNLAWKGARYLTIVNSSEEAVTAMIEGLPYGSGVTFEAIGDQEKGENKFTVPEGGCQLKFAPLEVKLFKVYNAR